MPRWKRFRSTKATLPSAVTASVLCAVALAAIWYNFGDDKLQAERFGVHIAQTIAKTTAGDLLDNQRINLAVIANFVTEGAEVDGVTFFDNANNVIAMSGSQDSASRYTATATIDDTITGYVTIHLNSAAFRPATPWLHWLASVITVLVVPWLTVLLMQLSARGNRSLPIVSVQQENAGATPSYCLVINLINQLALSKAERDQAVTDAVNMGREVCAVYPGFAMPLDSQGACLVFSQNTVSGLQALHATFLLQTLLLEYETLGQFRCYLRTATCPGDPAEMNFLNPAQIQDWSNIDTDITLAALARKDTALISQEVFANLNDIEKSWAGAFEHPILPDLAPQQTLYSVAELPERDALLVKEQAQVILGFS
ncbi:MAG: hypothetical protein VXW50_10265 [Pseudomonadota bacterium]|nr:hypothetical protein [Pseudomonadota bacterium]